MFLVQESSCNLQLITSDSDWQAGEIVRASQWTGQYHEKILENNYQHMIIRDPRMTKTLVSRDDHAVSGPSSCPGSHSSGRATANAWSYSGLALGWRGSIMTLLSRWGDALFWIIQTNRGFQGFFGKVRQLWNPPHKKTFENQPKFW